MGTRKEFLPFLSFCGNFVKMLGLLRRNINDLRIICVQVNRVQAQRTMMKGPGGRLSNNPMPQGMTAKSLKSHYALIPLGVIMGIGMLFVAVFCVRLAVYSPDANWARKSFDEVSDYYKDSRMIYFNPRGIDFKRRGSRGPITSRSKTSHPYDTSVLLQLKNSLSDKP